MKYFTLVLATLGVLYTAKSCTDKNREIRRLNSQIETLKEERPDIWIDSCKSAVMQTCFYGECATVPIEIIQEKVCKAPEDL